MIIIECLGNVIVLILIIFISFHVVTINQRFNTFLQIGRLKSELKHTISKYFSIGIYNLDFWSSQATNFEGQNTYFDWERQLFVQFTNEEVVTECLSHFHNTNNSCINLILTILIDTFFGSLLLFRLEN